MLILTDETYLNRWKPFARRSRGQFGRVSSGDVNLMCAGLWGSYQPGPRRRGWCRAVARCRGAPHGRSPGTTQLPASPPDHTRQHSTETNFRFQHDTVQSQTNANAQAPQSDSNRHIKPKCFHLCCVTCSCRRSSPALTMKDARRHPSNRPNGESLRIRYTHRQARDVRLIGYTFSSQQGDSMLHHHTTTAWAIGKWRLLLGVTCSFQCHSSPKTLVTVSRFLLSGSSSRKSTPAP